MSAHRAPMDCRHLLSPLQELLVGNLKLGGPEVQQSLFLLLIIVFTILLPRWMGGGAPQQLGATRATDQGGAPRTGS